MPKWVVSFENFNDEGEKICGPFCVELPCEVGPDGHTACLTCTTFLCGPIAALTLPPGVSSQTFAFTGTEVGDAAFAALAILPAGVTITDAVVPTDGSITLTFNNSTGVPQTIPAQSLQVVVTRQCE